MSEVKAPARIVDIVANALTQVGVKHVWIPAAIPQVTEGWNPRQLAEAIAPLILRDMLELLKGK